MGSRRPGSRRDDRRISAEEAQLWQAVTRSVAPVKAKPRVAGPAEAEAAVPAPCTQQDRRQSTHEGAEHGAPADARAARTHPSAAPLASLDRRQARGIATGRIAIGARLDLHGCRERDARARLGAFLFAAQEQGHTTVLVITGKGGAWPTPRSQPHPHPGSPQRDAVLERASGVLRRMVPRWLAEPDLRALVAGYAEAGVRHGGAGALYVRLRRRDRARG
jgi:DNA-nicking Smr family endonuclease